MTYNERLREILEAVTHCFISEDRITQATEEIKALMGNPVGYEQLLHGKHFGLVKVGSVHDQSPIHPEKDTAGWSYRPLYAIEPGD